jgi:hypothetical protein
MPGRPLILAPLGCIDILSKPSCGASDGDGCMEVLFEFIEACSESSELFEMGEGTFDAVALAVESAVEVALDFAQRSRRDDGSDAAFAKMAQNGVGVVALVGEYGLRAAFAEQRDSLSRVVGLASGQHEAKWQSKLIREQVDFGRQTSSTPPQSGLRSPFFRAVAAC